MFAAGKDLHIDPEPEKIAFSSVIQKINKHGFKQSRYLMITQKCIYNAEKKKNSWKIKRSIDIKKVEAMTISKPNLNSNELIIHVKDEYDYRYTAP